MTLPTITRIDFSPAGLVLTTVEPVATYTFPLALRPALVIDATPAVTALSAQMTGISKVLDAFMHSAAPPPPPGPAAATVFPGTAGGLVPGGTLTLPAGIVKAILNANVPQIITGAGMRATILDGQGGVEAGHRLSFGKGVVHAMASLQISDVGFINGGSGGTSDGGAGLWVGDDATPIDLTATRCAFDGNENGFFCPSGTPANVLLDRCVFGRNAPNGLSDGRSHDIYAGPLHLRIIKGVFVGNSVANTIKVRGGELVLEDTYVGRGNGRWLDMPGGTVATSTRNLYVTNPGAGSANAFGLFDENDAADAPGPGSFTSTDDTFVFSRASETWWINHADSLVTFIRPKVMWIGAKGSTPPSVAIQGPGSITGGSPFVFTEANRLDNAPPVPPDPV